MQVVKTQVKIASWRGYSDCKLCIHQILDIWAKPLGELIFKNSWVPRKCTRFLQPRHHNSSKSQSPQTNKRDACVLSTKHMPATAVGLKRDWIYNEHMGGVDSMDQIAKHWTLAGRPSDNYWNSPSTWWTLPSQTYIVYQKKTSQRPAMSHLKFWEELDGMLIACYVVSKPLRGRPSLGEKEARLTERHFTHS